MDSALYRLANGCLLLVQGDAKVAIINPEDTPLSNKPETASSYANSLRELADTIEAAELQMPSSPSS